MLKYIDLHYKPGSSDVVCEYNAMPEGITIEQAAEKIVQDNVGGWHESFPDKLRPRVFSIDYSKNKIKVAYPLSLFEPGNIAQILSMLRHSLSIRFPKKLVDSFPGPAFGIQGLRKLSRTSRPLVSAAIMHLMHDEEGHAKSAYDAWTGGVDIIHDHFNITSHPFNSFSRRIKEVLARQHKAEDRTGEMKFYIPNITASAGEMMKRAQEVKSLGGRAVMVDMRAGLSSLHELRNSGPGIAIFSNHDNPLIARMLGADIVLGANIDECIKSFYSKKQAFPVISGHHPGRIPTLLNNHGSEIIMSFSEGCHEHPSGTFAGARAIRQSLHAAMRKKDLRKFALSNPDLEKALFKWGF